MEFKLSLSADWTILHSWHVAATQFSSLFRDKTRQAMILQKALDAMTRKQVKGNFQ